MTQLQKIVTKAKTLRKSYPNAKWTDLIKKASKLVTPASKSVAGTKKKAVKKHAPIKPLAKKKKAVKKSPARSLHKDTKSHNVNIRVMSGAKRSKTRSAESEKIRSTVKKDGFIMPHGYGVTKGKRVVSGIGSDAMNRIKHLQQRILSQETMANNIKSLMKSDKYKKDKEFIKEGKKTIMTITKVNKDYKKMITALKKHI
jgi:phage shock protein A